MNTSIALFIYTEFTKKKVSELLMSADACSLVAVLPARSKRNNIDGEVEKGASYKKQH